MAFIYKLVFPNDNRIYVGQTCQKLLERLRKHITLLNTGKHHNKKILKVWPSCGVPTIEVLEECSNDKLDSREVYWIAKLDSYINGFNATEGGDDTGRGHTHCRALYDEDTYIAILYCLAYTNWQAKEIAEELEVSIGVVQAISSGYSHTSLQESHKELYDIAINKSRKGMYQVKERGTLIDPNGTEHRVINISAFAAEHNLQRTCINMLFKGTRKTHKGWTVGTIAKD